MCAATVTGLMATGRLKIPGREPPARSVTSAVSTCTPCSEQHHSILHAPLPSPSGARAQWNFTPWSIAACSVLSKQPAPITAILSELSCSIKMLPSFNILEGDKFSFKYSVEYSGIIISYLKRFLSWLTLTYFLLDFGDPRVESWLWSWTK